MAAVELTNNVYLSLEERRLSRDLGALHDMQLFNTSHVFSFSSKGSQHLQHVAFIAYFHNSITFMYYLDLDLDLVLDLDLDLDLDLLPPPSSTSRILRPSSSSPSNLSKAYSMSLLDVRYQFSDFGTFRANLLPNSTMPSPTLGWLVLV